MSGHTPPPEKSYEPPKMPEYPPAAPFPTPTIGKTVHYTNLGDSEGRYPPEQQAAIITGINDDGTASLKILYKTGIFDMPSVPYSETYKRGHWSWPPKV